MASFLQTMMGWYRLLNGGPKKATLDRNKKRGPDWPSPLACPAVPTLFDEIAGARILQRQPHWSKRQCIFHAVNVARVGLAPAACSTSLCLAGRSRRLWLQIVHSGSLTRCRSPLWRRGDFTKCFAGARRRQHCTATCSDWQVPSGVLLDTRSCICLR